MATPIRFAPVLTGKEAVEFYERWNQSQKELDTRYPSEEKLNQLKELFRKNVENKFRN